MGDVPASQLPVAEAITVQRVESPHGHVRVSSVHGPEDRVFVLVAGIGVASTYYVRLAHRLAERATVHALDLPGFGGVRTDAGVIDIAGFADDVEAALDALGLVNPVLIGQSMGTQVVTEVAARRPEIERVVLIGPVIDAGRRRIVPQVGRFLCSAVHEPSAIRVYAVSSYVLCGPRRFFAQVTPMMRYPIEQRLADVAAQVVIVRGEHDYNVPREWVHRLLGVAGSARAVEIQRAAHTVMYSHAHEVADICLGHRDHTAETALAGTFTVQRPRKRKHARPRIHPKFVASKVAGMVLTTRGMVADDETLIARGSRRERSAVLRSEHRRRRDQPHA